MKFKKILLSLCVGAAVATACTDAWDDHYNSTDGLVGVPTQTLWELILQDESLYHFARVIVATGYADELNGQNLLSVWAVPITQEEADEWILIYANDKIAGLKDEDNTAVVRFVQNHICLYNRTVSSFTENDTVKMLNGKYKYLSSGNISGATLLRKNVLATNGVLYKIDGTLPFFKNVYEELMDNERVSHFAEFLKGYNEYTLDVSSSVPGEIIDGKIHYLDSVTYMSNFFMNRYDSYINKEDSLYMLFAPTNHVWDTQYQRYSKYFVYPPVTANRDSLQDVRTKMAIFCSRTFNINPDVNPEWAKEDEMQRDSLMSTSYSIFDWENHVFYHPFAEGGLLANRDNIKCSNGLLVIDDTDYSIDARCTFLADVKTNATRTKWLYGSDDETDSKKYNNYTELNQNIARTVSLNYTDSIHNADGTLSKLHMNGDRYMVFSGTSNTAYDATKFTFPINGVYSGVYYNVYFVFAPPFSINDPYLLEDYGLPTKFRAYLHEMQADGKLSSGINSATVRILDPATDERNIATKAGIVDTLCLLKAHQFNYTDLNGDNVANIYITSYVSPPEKNQKKFTRNIRVNAMILRPFETKEDAEKDFQEYLDARNLK